MSAFTDRLISPSSKGLRLRVSIDGVPLSFEAANNLVDPASFGFLDGRGMLVSVDESRTMLDRQERRQVGGGATIVVQGRGNILRALFAQRSFRATFVRLATTPTVTTIGVDSTADIPSIGVVYIAGETIRYTGTTSNTLTGCTRGYLGSPAQRHQGDADTGAGVYLAPPSWLGRRVRLQGYFDDDDGGANFSTIDTLGTFRLERAPQDLGEGRWELQCSHLGDELAKRKLGTGLNEMPMATSVFANLRATIISGVEVLEFFAPPGTARMLTQGTAGTHAMIDVTATVPGVGGISIHPVHSVVAATLVDTIRLVAAPRSGRGGLYGFIFATGLIGQNYPLTVASVRHLAILDGTSPAETMRQALTSRVGDGANGVDDVLGGVESTALGGPGFRFGAGIAVAEVDGASLATTSVPDGWSWVIDEELPLGDLLRDYCRQSNTAAVFTSTGQLRFTPLLEQRQSAVANIVEADVRGKIVAAVDEGAIYSRVRLACSYDPIDGEYEGSITIIDEEIALTYAPAEGSLDLESRAVVIQPVDIGGDGTLIRPTMVVQELQNEMRRTMLDSRGGSLLLSMRLGAKHIGLQLGDLVTLALPSVSDFRGGTLAGAKGRVVERQPDWKTLDVDVTVLVEEVLSHFAPGLVIVTATDLGGGESRVTVSTADFGASTTPVTKGIRVGDRYRVYDPVNNVSVGSGVDVIRDVASATVDVLDVGGSLPLAAGWVLLLVEATDDAAPDGFTGRDYAYFGANNNGITSRWR